MTPLELGGIIKNWRKSNNISRETLGSLVGVSHNAIRKWERGKSIMTVKHATRLANLMSVHNDIFQQMILDIKE